MNWAEYKEYQSRLEGHVDLVHDPADENDPWLKGRIESYRARGLKVRCLHPLKTRKENPVNGTHGTPDVSGQTPAAVERPKPLVIRT